MKEKIKIPKGLYKCEKCGEYKGGVKDKAAGKSEKYLTVLCLCDGILCPKCKKNKIHKPISNSYDSDTNTIGHWPYFTGMMGCGECREVSSGIGCEYKGLTNLSRRCSIRS